MDMLETHDVGEVEKGVQWCGDAVHGPFHEMFRAVTFPTSMFPLPPTSNHQSLATSL
jgi:hypothetical protein